MYFLSVVPGWHLFIYFLSVLPGTCPGLDRPEGVYLLPPRCARKRVARNNFCYVLCDDGYHSTAGNTPLVCRLDGTWSKSIWDSRCTSKSIVNKMMRR